MVDNEPVLRLSDPRGFVFEPLAGEDLAIQKNGHVVVTRPGAVRGNHYHLKGTETLVICGPALVRIRRENTVQDFSIPKNAISRFVIPPGVAHAVKNTGDTDCLLVAFNTEPHNPDEPDLVQDILIPL